MPEGARDRERHAQENVSRRAHQGGDPQGSLRVRVVKSSRRREMA